ncbi:MAG: hypothetical protein KGK33_10455 [Hyphomicrobiales bacterium]|nr:hypothetical protein [Hyphomicrobiales bacterium]MDE2285024.1 hypothetical protein [Hyphomicrobiales bacterium]
MEYVYIVESIADLRRVFAGKKPCLRAKVRHPVELTNRAREMAVSRDRKGEQNPHKTRVNQRLITARSAANKRYF